MWVSTQFFVIKCIYFIDGLTHFLTIDCPYFSRDCREIYQDFAIIVIFLSKLMFSLYKTKIHGCYRLEMHPSPHDAFLFHLQKGELSCTQANSFFPRSWITFPCIASAGVLPAIKASVM